MKRPKFNDLCEKDFYYLFLRKQSYNQTVGIKQAKIFAYNSGSLQMTKYSKVIFLGDSAVGKTSLLSAYVQQKSIQLYKSTVGADFMEKKVIVNGKTINLEIWDTAGQQRYYSLGAAFYRGTDCCVLVYDITNQTSFQNIEMWMTAFLDKGFPRQPECFPFVLIGNKIDREEDRKVEKSSVQQFLAKNPRIIHLTASAKNRQGLQEAFQKIALASIQNIREELLFPIKLPNYGKKTRRCC